MAQTLESLIEKEYETVQKEREALLARRAEIDDKLRALDRRLDAAANYKATLEGKFARPTRAPSQRKAATGTRAPRGAGGEMQKKILAVVAQFPEGAPPKSSTLNSAPPMRQRRSQSPPPSSG